MDTMPVTPLLHEKVLSGPVLMPVLSLSLR
jgi:hypothetical protein